MNEKRKTINKTFSTKEQNLKTKKYSNEKVHSYFYNRLQNNIKTDTNISNKRSAERSMTSLTHSLTHPLTHPPTYRSKMLNVCNTCPVIQICKTNYVSKLGAEMKVELVNY